MVKDHFLREIPQGEVIEFIQRITPLCLTRLVCDNLLRNGHKIHFGQLKGGQAGDFSSRFAEQVWAQHSLLPQT